MDTTNESSAAASAPRPFHSVDVQVDRVWGLRAAYMSMLCCYHSEPVADFPEMPSNVLTLEQRVTDVLTKGHWSIAEQIPVFVTLSGIPHDVAMQFRTHRHLSCQVTSQRYTGDRLLAVNPYSLPADWIAEMFYLQPPGRYRGRASQMHSRNGVYEITREQYAEAEQAVRNGVEVFQLLVRAGQPEETARRFLPQGIRQNMVLGGNLRSLLHVCSVRTMLDAQLDCRLVAEEIVAQLTAQLPTIMAAWAPKYHRRNRLAP